MIVTAPSSIKHCRCVRLPGTECIPSVGKGTSNANEPFGVLRPKMMSSGIASLAPKLPDCATCAVLRVLCHWAFET